MTRSARGAGSRSVVQLGPLAGVTGGSVVAFDLDARTWVPAARATPTPTPGLVAAPRLDGELTTAPAALADVASDFGHIVSRAPVAVLRPGSVRDVVRMTRYANRHGLRVAMRGRGHSTHGQSQVEAGVVIDSRTLATIHEVGTETAVVDAGVLWSELVRETLAKGLTPPVLTDHLGLTVGGTLGVGGVSGASQRYGPQVDTVTELVVVTGDGRLVRCSPARRRFLFESVLGGLGQYGILVRATLRLVPAPRRARVYRLTYDDLAAYLRDQCWLVEQERFWFHEGQVHHRPGRNGWEYVIEAAALLRDGEAADDGALLAGLRPLPGRTLITEVDYREWTERLTPLVAERVESGTWSWPKPWFTVFLPASRTAEVVSAALDALHPSMNSSSTVQLYPVRTALFRRSLVQVPDEPVAFLFALRRSVPPGTAAVEAQLAANREIYRATRDAGGVRYPIGSPAGSPTDWCDHYGETYRRAVLAKALFDPGHVLTPGQGVFAEAGQGGFAADGG